MINFYLDTILFYLVTVLFFFSLSGYGKFVFSLLNFSKTELNFFELNFLGNIFYLILGFTISISIGHNIYLNLSVAFFGLLLFFFYKKNLNVISLKKVFFYISVLFSFLLISKTHEDFVSYHIQSINDIFYNNITFGIANYDINAAHTSLFSYVQVLYFLPFFSSKLIHIPIFLMFFSTLGYFYLVLKKSKQKKLEFTFCCFLFFVLILKFTRLSEYGYDYISQFLLLIVFHKVFFGNTSEDQLYKPLIFFSFAVSIKIVVIVSIPLLIFILKNKVLKIFSHRFIFLILILNFILIFNSFSRTGCIFYPINSTCFDQNKISWSVKEKIKNHSEKVELWAKGFWGQKKSKETIISDKKKYLNEFNWVKVWIDIHFFYKIFEYILILTFIYFLLLLSSKKNFIFLDFKKKNMSALLISTLATYLWFITAPQFRFGFASCTIMFFFLSNFLISANEVLTNKLFRVLLVIFLIFFNIKNSLRIKNEILRSDIYQYKSFPWINQNILEKKFIKPN